MDKTAIKVVGLHALVVGVTTAVGTVVIDSVKLFIWSRR